MNSLDETLALKSLLLRLGHASAIARMIARTDDGDTGEAMNAMATILADLSDRLDAIIEGAAA